MTKVADGIALADLKEHANWAMSIDEDDAQPTAAAKEHGPKAPTAEKPNGWTEPEMDDEQVTGPMRYLGHAQQGMIDFVERNKLWLTRLVLGALLVGYHVYLGFAWHYNFARMEPLLVITGFFWVLGIYYLLLVPVFGSGFEKNVANPVQHIFNKFWNVLVLRLLFFALVAGGIAVFLYLDTRHDRKRLTGLIGMACFIAILFVCSKRPSKIRWRTVAWGYFLQFCLALLVLRWEWGSRKFHQISDQIVTFLDYTNNGTTFVYGFLAAPPNICGMSPVFAFSVLQVVVYFGSIVALLYYYGIMQIVLKKMAWFMQFTLGTTATESLNSCACIFLGQSEAPLLIKPYLARMTASELHAVMTSGFACIAGSLFAAYISFGACPSYLLSATVMSAPGSLACSKIMYPEEEESQLKNVDDLELPDGEESNALECISNGAVAAVELVLAIVANLIVFLALLAFIDNIFGYAGHLIGHEGWSFEKTLGYIFFPLAYVMGVTGDTQQTLDVAQLMGTKTALNEFIAYQHLGGMTSGPNPQLTARNAMIATYALCGFSNFSSIGIQLGVLGGMVPQKKPLLASISLRALMTGSISCFMTACVAGIIVQNPSYCAMSTQSNCFDVSAYQALLNSTMSSTVLPPTSTASSPLHLPRVEL